MLLLMDRPLIDTIVATAGRDVDARRAVDPGHELDAAARRGVHGLDDVDSDTCGFLPPRSPPDPAAGRSPSIASAGASVRHPAGDRRRRRAGLCDREGG